MTEMTAITLGSILLALSVLMLLWGFPSVPTKR